MKHATRHNTFTNLFLEISDAFCIFFRGMAQGGGGNVSIKTGKEVSVETTEKYREKEEAA